ncbi:uncharacterized protein LOC120281717 isoform X2 [Dioscorea cayenensis subsp. rotundata]|uniref:Uncharacterized protein LOC120281717 isoform X2 n=1 Tax=Dioscorea cayennensis subsp. rotundata TaxID=55577 RepID=A0AB40CWK6_DIOCR|nr:uncharacterized protein LOC120281717 isoform X2 [Dioscorea cayenensis subsp. rotundata]
MAITTITYSVWRSRLGSALRTAFACALVGYVTIYGPDALRLHLNFPAFSYVTVILIIGEATLGDTLHRVVQALYGITLSTLLAFLTLFFIDEHASIGIKSIALALSSFIVALPESMSLITVRVALGQTVLVHLASHKHGGPVNVAVSTAVGAAAAVIAIILPYPRFAYYEVKEKSWLYTDIVLERLRLLVSSFFSSDSSQTTAITPISSLRTVSAKLLQSIKLKQWERPLSMFLHAGDISSNGMESIEMALKGMEAALTSMASVPSEVLNQQPLRGNVLILGDQTCLIVKQYNFMTEKGMVNKTLESLHHIPLNLENLPLFFFLFCMKVLHDGLLMDSENSSSEESQKERNNKWIMSMINIERILTALKCSITLGLSALFGVLFNREYGFWCALTVAITITPWREATFKLANIRIQGAALGSVYGVLIGSTISEDLMQVRFLLLLPFIVFTSFLHKSRMYGQPGAIAAIISAMVILGRRKYGSPSAFAVVRLTEIFIGLLCSTIVELLLQPRRASTMARIQLSLSLQTLHDSMKQNKEKKLREQVNKLRKDIAEAEGEPNFWFLPFPVSCYNKLQNSLSKMVDLLHFLVPAMKILAQESHESLEAINEDVESLRNLISDSLKCFSVEKQENDPSDLEMGSGVGSLEFDKVVASFIQHGREAMEKLDGDVDGVVKGQVFLSLGAIGFCLEGLQRESKELKKGLLELLQLENPGRHKDFS